MVTFDGLRYSCQAKGDFILVKSSSGLQVQARFTQKNPQISLATGIAVSAGAAAPTIEISISQAGGLDLELFVGGTKQNFSGGYEDEYYTVTTSESGGNRVYVKATKVAVHADVLLRSVFKHFSTTVSLPQAFINGSHAICGLLGTPDKHASNDWTTSACTQALPVPVSYDALHNQGGYDYCTTNWCIRNETESLFTYGGNFNFEFFSGCDMPFGGAVDVSRASPELRLLCGIDIPCLTDGLELGFASAQSLLESESTIGRASAFQAVPSTIVVGVTYNVELTLDYSSTVGSLPSNLGSFNVYRINPETRHVGDTSIVSLVDNGSGLARDTTANDGIFTNVLALRSDIAGEAFGFVAYPVLGGVEARDSPLAYESLYAVRSYSNASGVGQSFENTTGTLTVADVSGLVVVVEYTWPLDQTDLDTGTQFLESVVGYRCGGSSPYLMWSGDNRGSGGKEFVRVALGSAYEARAWNNSTSLLLNAAWYPPDSAGPATLSVAVQSGEVVSFAIDPGRRAIRERSCATLVGRIDVVVTETGGARIEIKKETRAPTTPSPTNTPSPTSPTPPPDTASPTPPTPPPNTASPTPPTPPPDTPVPTPPE
jgi:glutaredoxin-related protein